MSNCILVYIWQEHLETIPSCSILLPEVCGSIYFVYISGEVTGAIVQCLRVFPTLVLDPGLVPAYMANDNHL